ncbi:MAG: glycoside hydrolase family 20 zincin-like fold domain-containing protein, partial [Bacteroidota bacterium]
KKMGDFEVLPIPQEMIVKGPSELTPQELQTFFAKDGVKAPPFGGLLSHLRPSKDTVGAQLVLAMDKNLDLAPEGYHLDIRNTKIILTGKDGAGLFYGCKTLEQLMVDAEEQQVNLPRCTITDYPLLGYRAVHWDIKHHLEKTEYYYDLIDKLASYKINAVLVEIEDKLAYGRQPKVASADALSITEWQKLSNYAKDRHIGISPLVQGLGHASFILKHPEYEHLRDNPKSDWAFNPLDPETYEVQFDLYRDAMAATPHGKFLHVGGDEVHTTGRNSGKSALELQLDWLGKVCVFAETHGRIPIFWDDMPLKEAGVYDPMFQPQMTQAQVDSIWAENEHQLSAFLDKFPKNCIYMRWNYSSPQALGNIKAMEWFKTNDLEVMGATAGQTRWVLMPQNESNMENIQSFARNAINSGSKGLLLTLWDDDSPHFELYKRGIIAFAENTWSGDQRDREALKSAYRQREFAHILKDSEMAFIDSLEAPVAFWKNALLKGNKRNFLKAMEDSLEKGIIDLPNPNEKGTWTQTHSGRLEEAEAILATTEGVGQKIKRAQESAIRNPYTLEVYEQVNQMARFAPKVLLALKTYDMAKNPKEEAIALEALELLQKEFEGLRNTLETVYGKTRILSKPRNYALDQDHHSHLANQSLNFDWQFYAEMLFFEKLEKALLVL